MPIDPTAIRTPVPSRPSPPKRRRWGRLPYSIRVAIPVLALVVVAYYAIQAFQHGRAHIRLVDTEGNAIAAEARLELFGYDARPSAVSPTPSIGSRNFDATGRLTVDGELIGEAALVRVDVPGHGIAYGYVTPGGETFDLVLGTPVDVHGVVVREEVDGAGGIAGARVLALGGGQRGVLLAETTTGQGGSFTFSGVSSSVRDWTFRVFADGFAVGELQWLSAPEQVVRIPLQATRPAVGRLVAMVDGDTVAPDLGDLELRIYQLPGVSARTAPDGSFEIPYLPPSPRRGYLLVPDLPDGWTYRRTAVVAGETTEVRVVPALTLSGHVVSGHPDVGVAGVAVHHEHGPLGIEATVSDSNGTFELQRVPLGPTEVFAHVMVDRVAISREARKEKRHTGRVLIQGSETLLVVPDRKPDELEITIW